MTLHHRGLATVSDARGVKTVVARHRHDHCGRVSLQCVIVELRVRRGWCRVPSFELTEITLLCYLSDRSDTPLRPAPSMENPLLGRRATFDVIVSSTAGPPGHRGPRVSSVVLHAASMAVPAAGLRVRLVSVAS